MDTLSKKQRKFRWRCHGHNKESEFKRETESLLIATQTDVIRTNKVAAKIDNVQQNSEYSLHGDRKE